MSKRYGRNQRRKHRDEITRLQTAYARETALLSDIDARRVRAEHIIQMMVQEIEEICAYSSMLPPKDVSGREPRDRHTLPMSVPFATLSEGPWGAMPQVNASALRLFLEDHRERFCTSIHLKYVAGGEATYMVSDVALRSMSREELVDRFAPSIARALLRHLRGENPHA